MRFSRSMMKGFQKYGLELAFGKFLAGELPKLGRLLIQVRPAAL
jgi:hypothetical protein